MSARLISAVFPGKCPVCGTAYAKGAPIYFDKAGERGRKAWCRAHGERPAWQPESAPLFDEPEPAPKFERADMAPMTPSAPEVLRGPVGNVYIRRFESLSDLGRYVLTAQPEAMDEDARKRNRHTANEVIDGRLYGGMKWSGLDKNEHRQGEKLAVAQARLYAEGWPRGLQMLQGLLDSFSDALPAPRSVRRRRTWGDQGDSVDMGRVWSGDLSRAWSRTAAREVRCASVATIYINASLSANQPQQVAFWRGAAGVVLADILTRAGYSVEIYACTTMRGTDARTTKDAAVTLALAKAAGAPLDLSALAAICSPAATRSHAFAAQTLFYPARASDCCGYPSRLSEVAPSLINKPNAHETPVQVTSAETARAWIAARIAELENTEQAAA